MHTFGIWVIRNRICDLGSAAKVQVQSWISLATPESLGDVEGVLSELIIGCTNDLPTYFDGCEGI